MIRFRGVSKSFALRGGGRKIVLRDLTLDLPGGMSLALLGRNGAGKSTLLQMIAGTMQPDRGRITCAGRVSWPMGFGGSFHPDLTGAQNVRFLARIYGVDTDSLADYVADFAELGAQFHMPVRSYSAGMKSRLTFGAAMGIRFDTYLIDEVTAVGDAQFRRKSRAVLQARLAQAGAIVVSHDLPQLREICQGALLLEEGQLRFVDDLDAAIATHKALLAA